eukprot:TRINITY_DN3210_c0_g1_i1.p1 TRINITY_DN3210_c0_g1~~TRINITY_DN3210_c0_g1_i1.p1  ORF type:complete len:317 (-),score=47.02 TRINITY_DN3210_c0_g1_i1:853-1776(-)
MKPGDSVNGIKLHDGTYHPAVGFGTYKIGYVPASSTSSSEKDQLFGGAEKAKVVFRQALDNGYRFFDCAQFYNNEHLLGEVLKESGIPRKELFLVSKIWTTNIYQGKAAIESQLEKTLTDLNTSYLDIYEIHWPVPGKHVAAYKVLESMREQGKIRNIGVSNYARDDYEELEKAGIQCKPAVNQIEVNPFLYRKELIDYFHSKGVKIQSYRGLRQGKEMENAVLQEAAKKYKKTPAQVLGRWLLEKGIIYIAKTTSPQRMVENQGVLDWKLEAADVAELDKLTSKESIDAAHELYLKCRIRDTPLAQ